MFAKKLIFNRTVTHFRWNAALRKSSQHIVRNPELTNLEVKFADPLEKKPTEGPLIKDLFLGNFNTDYLTFHEAVPNERYLDFISWLKPIEEYISQCVNNTEKLNPDDVVSHLRQLGVFRACVGANYNGLDFCESEVAKLTEILSALPWLGTYFARNHVQPVKLLTKYATDEQKQKYLPGIATGEVIPTICITEEHSRTSINSIKASLIQKTTSSDWELNGDKNFVYSGTKANLFLVLAYALNNAMKQQGNLVVSIVEGDHPGISCTGVEDTVGIKEIPICTVSFNNVLVKDNNIIKPTTEDFNPLVDILCPGRQNTGPQAITILRSFLDVLVNHMLSRKHFDQNMWELDAVKMVLSKIATAIYTMECLVYYTASLSDVYEDQDLMAERCIVETFCAEQCLTQIVNGMKLVGTNAYLRTQPFVKLLEDALSLNTLDINHMDANLYVALLGLRYSGEVLQSDVRKARNFTTYPRFNFAKMFQSDPVSNLDLKGHIHPSMVFGALAIETGIKTMRENVRMLFERHGIDVISKHEDLYRLTKVVSNIYVMVAAVSRASRSYCIGLKSSSEERNLAVQLACLGKEEIDRFVDEIQLKKLVDSDFTFRAIAEKMYTEKGYFIPHALERIQ